MAPHPAGLDAVLPDWLVAGGSRPEAPHFDSVVIRGGGIGALTCAARLARSETLAGRVVLAAPRPSTDRRLINGCTLRARTTDYLAAALGSSPEELIHTLFGARRAGAATTAQDFGLANPFVGSRRDEARAPGPVELQKLVVWMRGSAERPLAYGLRNGHLVETLAKAVEQRGVHFSGEVAESFDQCRALANGDRPLILNSAYLPLEGVPTAARPERFVVASQVTFQRREGARLEAGHSCIGMRRRDGAFDTGVYYPFADPLTPGADTYGIFYRIVRPGVPDFEKSRAIEAMRELVLGFGDTLGLSPVDAEATRGEAMVPCIPWRDVPTHRPDYMDLFRTYSACAPIITGDGMTRGALAGWLSAEAILAGEDPVAITNRSLQGWRSANRRFAWGMTRLSRPLGVILRTAPEFALRQVADQADMWARVA